MCLCESVYVSPDRSLEQKIKKRELIKDLRSRSIADPDNKYFIREGTICSVTKSKTDFQLVREQSCFRSHHSSVVFLRTLSSLSYLLVLFCKYTGLFCPHMQID